MLVACDEMQISETEQELIGGGEFSPAAFGALADDGADDREGLQAAVQAACNAGGGVIRLRAGLYELGPNPQPGATNVESIAVRCSNVRITGEGLSTVLQATGDSAGRDWNLIQIRSAPNSTAPVRNVEIDNVLLSGAGAYNTPEQTHLIQIGVGPIEGVSLHHVWFYHPVRAKLDGSGNEKGGDCIRMLGGPSKSVRFTQINDNQFINCDRSSISFQRGVHDTIIDSNVFLSVGDQHIDQEPSGNGPLGRLVISSNLFLFGSQGSHSITLTGTAIAEPSSEIVLSQNVLYGRGIALMNVQRTIISDNVIMSTVDNAEGVIHARKSNIDVLLRGNFIERLPGSAPGPVVSVVPYSSGFPSRWKIDGNRMVSNVDGFMINADSIAHLSVVNNDMEYRGPAAGVYSAVRLIASLAPVDNAQVFGNRASGPFGSVLQLSPTPFPIGAVSAVGNMSQGALTGIQCKNGTYSKPVVHASYYYDGATSAAKCPSALKLVAQFP